MEHKPANIRVGHDEKVKTTNLILLGLQHALAMSSTLVLATIVISQLDGSNLLAEQFIQLTILGIGLGTFFQSIKSRSFGSAYLCPSLCAPGYFSVSVMAIKTGGLPLMYGMNVLSSIFNGALAFIIPKLRHLFPTYIAGVVILMISLTLVVPGIQNALDISNFTYSNVQTSSLIISCISLALMILITLWGGKQLSQYSLIIGVVIGSILAIWYGFFNEHNFQSLHQASWLSMPHPANIFNMKFSWDLLIPFIVTSLCVTLQAVGNLMTCQRINDSTWLRPDMENIKKGILATAASNLITSAIGGMPHSTSSSNIGLSVASAVTSRFVGFSAGLIYIALAFSPKLAVLFLTIPIPVKGAILLFVASFMMMAGIKIIGMGAENMRKTFTIGLSIMLGITAMILPNSITNELPRELLPLVDSPLALATIVAFVLNLFFRIGITRHAKLAIEYGPNLIEKLWKFISIQGSYWFALPEIAQKAAQAASECIEALANLGITKDVTLEVQFDDFDLCVCIIYQGELLNLEAKKPTRAQLLTEAHAGADLSIYMMKEYADKVLAQISNGKSIIKLYFYQ